jgi:hypothetical protein
MPPELSMAAIVERLEAQIEFHREREAFGRASEVCRKARGKCHKERGEP